MSQEINQLYQCLEFDFNPLSLCRKVKPLLESLSAIEDTAVYVGSLREVTLVRFVKQVRERVQLLKTISIFVSFKISQVYHSIPLSRLAELSIIATPMELERIVVETARTNDIEVCMHLMSECCVTGLVRLRLIISLIHCGLVKT